MAAEGNVAASALMPRALRVGIGDLLAGATDAQ